MNPLRVTLIQTSLHWENPVQNMEMLSAKISGVNDTDLIVLPETFSTGFSMRANELAEEMNGPSMQWMKKTAAQKNAVITGSLELREGGKLYNRLIWMRPDGSFETYDKRHLFSLSDEPRVFTPGTKRLIVELKGWRICPLICYDLRFPVWSRNKGEYDLLLYVANWPERRSYAWKHLLLARAIENLSYVAGVSCVGNDGLDVYHAGDSMVLDPLGAVLYHKQDVEDVATVTLSYDELTKVRSTLPFLKDADTFSL